MPWPLHMDETDSGVSEESLSPVLEAWVRARLVADRMCLWGRSMRKAVGSVLVRARGSPHHDGQFATHGSQRSRGGQVGCNHLEALRMELHVFRQMELQDNLRRQQPPRVREFSCRVCRKVLCNRWSEKEVNLMMKSSHRIRAYLDHEGNLYCPGCASAANKRQPRTLELRHVKHLETDSCSLCYRDGTEEHPEPTTYCGVGSREPYLHPCGEHHTCRQCAKRVDRCPYCRADGTAVMNPLETTRLRWLERKQQEVHMPYPCETSVSVV
mmetsp:Transcript_45639/g.108662  ORF Transcript_45639/g.108662 Transcript_45639/m.108662 type:complete len:269 (-) Transcript_45639:258-1064(-)